MPTPPDLTRLSHAAKDGLILALFAQLASAQERTAAQDARIAALRARLGALTQPPKTSDNSSKLPSPGQKQDRPAADTSRLPRKSRPGEGRVLHPNPDRASEARLAACPQCDAAFPDATQSPQQVYERIELPPVRPDVTQARVFDITRHQYLYVGWTGSSGRSGQKARTSCVNACSPTAPICSCS